MGTKWKFADPLTADVFTFAINGSDGGEPALHKEVTTQTTGPDRLPLFVVNGQAPGEFSIKSTLLSTQDRDDLIVWVDKDHQFLWINDLNEVRWIYIDSFTPTRKHVVSHPYRADYDLHAFVLENIPVPTVYLAALELGYPSLFNFPSLTNYPLTP